MYISIFLVRREFTLARQCRQAAVEIGVKDFLPSRLILVRSAHEREDRPGLGKCSFSRTPQGCQPSSSFFTGCLDNLSARSSRFALGLLEVLSCKLYKSIIEPSTLRWQRSCFGNGGRLWDNECWMSSHSTVKILCHFHAAIYNVLSKGKQGMRKVHFWTGSGHLRLKCKEQQSLIADHLYTAHYKCECDWSCTNVPQFSTKSIFVDVHQFK